MTALDRWSLLIHAGATCYMVGLIWFVQIVHYPLFEGVSEAQFPSYETRHQQLTTLVVGPAMLIEVCSAAMLLYRGNGPSWMLWLGLGLLIVIWISTACLQVPCHEALASGFKEPIHRWLVMTNWLRTVAWSVRGILSLWLIEQAFAR